MKRSSVQPRWYGIAIAVGLGFGLVGAASWHFAAVRPAALLNRTVQIIRQLPTAASPSPINVLPPTEATIAAALQTKRVNHNLATLTANTTLTKLSRLLTLEAEDNKSLDSPLSTKELLLSLSPNQPRQIDTRLWFVPASTAVDWAAQLASDSAVLNPDYRHFGIATRSAALAGEPGTIVLLTLSTPFNSVVASPAPRATAATPTFTGQDLWQAVQNYRQAHNLPLFTQNNELCTVASIRVNELLELGKLDNHAGFQPQVDAFFAAHPNWRDINENLAAGYQTAVQTVEWGWDQSLGHQALIQSREFPQACAAANRGFAVLITGR